jgi:hypothetical protein
MVYVVLLLYTLYALRSTPYFSKHLTLYAKRSTLNAQRFTLYASRFTLYALQLISGGKSEVNKRHKLMLDYN